jgi:hypothetical protein
MDIKKAIIVIDEHGNDFRVDGCNKVWPMLCYINQEFNLNISLLN